MLRSVFTGAWGALARTAVIVTFLSFLPGTGQAEEKLRALIVDGQNNHDWERTTPYLRKLLESTGRFTVSVVTTPPKGLNNPNAWNGFRPQFSDYDVIVSNYNGETWPEHARVAFEKYVREGGGVVNIHAANNPFEDWPAFNEMIGLAWRKAEFGEALVLGADGQEVRLKAGEGQGAGHGPRYAYPVVIRDREHPVMQGLPPEWMHPADELYHGQRGPALNMAILATAYSSSEQKGTGYHEPMVWWIPYGQGKVFTNVLGHVGRGQPQEEWPMRDTAYQTIVVRSCEWVATGKVTIPLPQHLPTAEDVYLGQ